MCILFFFFQSNNKNVMYAFKYSLQFMATEWIQNDNTQKYETFRTSYISKALTYLNDYVPR